MYNVTLQPIKRQFVKHVEYVNGNISFEAIAGASVYKLYKKEFSRDNWEYAGEITPAGTSVQGDDYTEITVAVVFDDDYEQNPKDCIPFAPMMDHMQNVIVGNGDTLTSYGSKMLMEFPEAIRAKYNDMSNLGISSHIFGYALDGIKQNMRNVSTLKKYKPTQDSPDIAYTFDNMQFAGLPYGIRNNIQYTLEDISSKPVAFPNGLEADTRVNTSDFANVVGDISSTKITDKFTRYYNLKAKPEDVVIYYSKTNATLTMYSSDTKDFIGAFTVVYNGMDILYNTTIVGVDVTPEYLYVAYINNDTLNVAIIGKNIPVGSNTLEAEQILSTSVPLDTILGMKAYSNEIVFQTETEYLAYRKMFNYYYVKDSTLYTFEDYSAVVVDGVSYHYNNYSNIWTDIDDMMQLFGRYRAEGETVGAFYFRMIHELMMPINATTPAIKSYMYYIANDKPYSTSIEIAPFNEHSFFQNMDNGITSNILSKILESNKTVWGSAEWENVFKASNNAFANNVFYPKYDNADGTMVNGLSYATPSDGTFMYSDNTVWYEIDGKNTYMERVSDGQALTHTPADAEPIIATNNNVTFLRDVDALSRVAEIKTAESYDYLQMQSTSAINVTIEYEATDGNTYTDSGTFSDGAFTLNERIASDGYISIEATDEGGNPIDIYILKADNIFAAYNGETNTINIYPTDKQITIEYVEA